MSGLHGDRTSMRRGVLAARRVQDLLSRGRDLRVPLVLYCQACSRRCGPCAASAKSARSERSPARSPALLPAQLECSAPPDPPAPAPEAASPAGGEALSQRSLPPPRGTSGGIREPAEAVRGPPRRPSPLGTLRLTPVAIRKKHAAARGGRSGMTVIRTGLRGRMLQRVLRHCSQHHARDGVT